MSYADNATSGMLWLAFGSVVAKASSFLSLIVLGWYLSKEEFALYALAYSSSVFFIAIRNGGVNQIILQRGVNGFDKAANIYMRYALLINLLVMVLILLFSPVVSAVYNTDEMYALLIIIAISLPLGTAGLFYRSKLAVDLKFSDVAKFDSYSSIMRHGSAALFAVLGFGVFSFLLPLIVVAIFELIYGKYKTDVSLFTERRLTKYFFKKIFNSTRWLILSTVAISIASQGDYLVIGMFKSMEIVGLYFFGFQFTVAFTVVIARGMQAVIMPLMSNIRHDKKRMGDAFSKMLVVLVLCVTVISFLMSIVSGFFVHYIWNGKWDDAIPVIQIMSLSLVTSVLVPLGKSMLEAIGQWRTVSYMMVIDAVGILIAAFVGAHLGDLIIIAVTVGIYRFVYAFLFTLYVVSRFDMNIYPVIKLIFYSIIAAVIPLCILIYLNNMQVVQYDWLLMLFYLSFFSVVFTMLSYIMQPKNSKVVFDFTRNFIIKKSSLI